MVYTCCTAWGLGMPWKETTPMLERSQFVRAWETGLYTVTELSQDFGISRATAYKWIHRYQDFGDDGLKEKSRRPHNSPRKTPAEIEEAIVALRKKKPRWGPKKIIEVLSNVEPEVRWPAPSTAGEVLKRHGMIKPQKRRRRWRHPGTPPILATRANELWTIDFKGQFRLGDRSICYPLTIQDRWSRYILTCRGLKGPFLVDVKATMEHAFREYGLPVRIRSDNGGPFVSRGIGGLTKLNVWWLSLGIEHERIEKGRPDQNGAHERMHRELKAETANPPAPDISRQEVRFDTFRQEYNYERPHEGIDQKLPGDLWVTSQRPYPAFLDQPEYPISFEQRKVDSSGHFKIRGKACFISEALKGCTIGMKPIDDSIWAIFYSNTLLGRFDERTRRIYE